MISDKSFSCPYDRRPVKLQKLSAEKYYYCKFCKRKYPFLHTVPNFLPDGLREWTQSKNKKTMPTQGKWKPGFRGWRPNFLIKLISFGLGEGRIGKKSKGTVLDVGCGDVAKGDFNTDVYIPNPLPKNFILATAEMLPFRDGSFDIVRSAYVIEHNLYPVEMIKEHYRVAKKKVEIFTDNSDWFGVYVYRLLNVGSIFHDEHYFKWSKEYFSNIIRRLGYKGKVSVFNTSPSLLVKISSLFGILPRIGVVFYRDLYAEIDKKS